MRNARKCYPGNTHAPQKTRTDDCAVEIINNEMRKMNRKTSWGHFGEIDGACPGLSLRLGGNGPETTEVKLVSEAHSLSGLFASLGLAKSGLSTVGVAAPSQSSVWGDPSPSARQRGRQPTNPVGLRGSPQAAPLPRSTCASPAASLLQSKQTPQPGSDFTSVTAGPAHSFCPLFLTRPPECAKENATGLSCAPHSRAKAFQRPFRYSAETHLGVF